MPGTHYTKPDYPIYLTGASSPETISASSSRTDLGLLVTPLNSVHRQLPAYELFAADNGVYGWSKAGKPFNADLWLRWLEALPLDGCLFATLPDVLEWHYDPELDATIPIGNRDATLELSARYVDTVAELGFPIALVAQDGLRSLSEVPFVDELDAVFVGGSDGYKDGPEAANVVAEANARGLWTHIGRVNTWRRLSHAAAIGADSVDGTKVRFGSKINTPILTRWLDRLEAAA